MSMEEVIARSDIISLHCPADGNKNLFDAEAFHRMKSSAVIIDEAALDEALTKGEIAGAALDCMAGEPVDKNCPLFCHENLLVTPHMAWYSEESARELKCKVAEESVSIATGKALRYPINHLS